jgi:serine/threonine protein kinase
MDSPISAQRCTECGSLLRPEQCGGLCAKCLALGLLSNPDPLASTDSASESPIRFDHLTLIGSGGMGAVYEAYDRKLARSVALKFLHANLMSNPAARLRFELEALVSSQLEHPGVIPIYDTGRDVEGRPFYVMRRVHGGTLSDVLSGLQKHEPTFIQNFDLSRLLSLFEKLCSAVAFAHSRKIIHRDLKPANIILGQFGEVFVMDWGLAKPLEPLPALDKLVEGEAFFSEMASYERERLLRMARVRTDTTPDAILGTLGFMAPEQADGCGHEADQRTDIYALGAILYNILTLHPPVLGTENRSVLHKTASGRIKHPLEYQSHKWFERAHPLPHCPKGRIPPVLANTAMKALAKLPSDRFQSVSDLLDSLPK